MNLSKKMIACAVIVIALLSGTSTYAQMGGGGGQRGDTAAMRQRQEQMLQQLKTDLKLTDVQSDSVSAIQKEFQAKRRTIFMDQSMSRDDKMAQMQPITDAMNKRLQAALGSDLFAKYQTWMQDHRPQRGGGGGGQRGNN